jgi:PEP phosphonomutase and related enzymes
MRTKMTTVLRQLIAEKEITFQVTVATAIHAQMAEAQGFKLIGASGSNFSSHVLGLPDAGMTTMTEMVENIRRIAHAVEIPLIPDVESGFGTAINVRRTVKEVILAGAAGLFLEDQTFPPRCGFSKGKTLVSIEEACGKFRAACDARDEIDPDFVIMARCDARTAVGGGIEETIRRCKAYREAGADVIYIEAPQTREEIAAVRAAVDGPMSCSVHALKPLPSLQDLQDLGMCMTMGNHFYKAGLVAMWDLLADMKVRGLAPYNEFMGSTASHPMGSYGPFDLTGFPTVAAWEDKYLPKSAIDKYEESIGLYDPRKGHVTAVRTIPAATVDGAE